MMDRQSDITAGQEWPEFRDWYALTMEEERLYNLTPSPADFDAQIERIEAQRRPLEAAMIARQPRTLTEIAMLGVVSLRWADRFAPDHGGYRALEIGTQRQPDEPIGERPQAALIEGAARLAIDFGLLPGVVIHDRRGNPVGVELPQSN